METSLPMLGRLTETVCDCRTADLPHPSSEARLVPQTYYFAHRLLRENAFRARLAT